MSVIHQSDAYFMANIKYFPADKAVYLNEKLRTMNNETYFIQKKTREANINKIMLWL